MKSLAYSAGVLMAGLATSFAIPLTKGNSEYVLLVQTHKGSSTQQTTLLDKDESEVYASACSNKLDSGALKDHAIVAKLDDNDGSGTITIGSQTYQVHEDHAVSGGISCGRIFGGDEHFVSCEIQLPDTLGVSKSKVDDANCFGDHLDKAPRFHKHSENINNSLNKGHPSELNPTTSNSRRAIPFGKRQYECMQWSSVSEVYERQKGDKGDPHQNYLDKQLSEVINCDAAPTCSVGETKSTSYNIGWSASATAWEWLSAGFDVGISWTTGNSYTCGGNKGDTVCVWYSTAHTAYTVQNHMVNEECGGDNPSGGPFVMFSPNSANRGGKGYYCVVGEKFCRAQGDQYWDYSGPAGGP